MAAAHVKENIKSKKIEKYNITLTFKITKITIISLVSIHDSTV